MSATICTDFKTYKFISNVSDYNFTKKKIQLLEDLNCLTDTAIKISEEEKHTFTTYFLEQRYKLDRYVKNISNFIDLIKLNIPKDVVPIVSLEGVSYGAKGSALVDICVSTGMLRQQILNELLKGDSTKFFVFSPGEMKNSMKVKGNGDKLAVYNQFKLDPILETIKNTEFYKFISTNEDRIIINNGKVVESPINDIIDSFLSILCIYNSKNSK